jgi:hypothetical protein
LTGIPRIQHAIDSVKAERIVLDTIESLISGAIKRDL